MKNLIATLLCVLVCISISSCATRSVSNQNATMVPSNRILSTEYLTKLPNTGTVIIKRDSGILGSGCSSKVFVNGKPTARLRPSEKIALYLSEGEYIFSAWPGICGGGLSEVSGNVKVDEQISFRIGYGNSGDFFINRTAF